MDFPIYHSNSRSLKRTVFAAASGRFRQDGQNRIVVQALRDVSFELKSGDRLGLIGSNGAGKTTLLRTLAGIYEPVQGKVEIQGQIGALLDTMLGMNGDMTGRENITLRGLYAGLGRSAIRRLEEDVQEFAELGEFMDLPMRLYSSGMTIRLGFGLSTAIRPEVLLMDEWFSAGDAVFLSKATERLETIVKNAQIMVLSSHSTGSILQWCNRAIWMEQGKVVADGKPQEVIDRYLGFEAKTHPELEMPTHAA